MEQQHFKKKLASVVNISEAIASVCVNRLDFDLQWDFDEFSDAIKEPVERYNKEKQKNIEEIGVQEGGGWRFNQYILAERMEKQDSKMIEFDATPISLEVFKAEIERKKKAGATVEIDGFSLRALKQEGVLVSEDGEGKKKGPRRNE